MNAACVKEQRSLTLVERGREMARAGEIFFKNRLTILDTRKDYGKERFISAGLSNNPMVFLSSPRGGEQPSIAVKRKANDREQ